MLGTPERWKKLLSLIPDQGLREALDGLMVQCNNSVQRWSTIQHEVTKAINKVKGKERCGCWKTKSSPSVHVPVSLFC